MDNELMLDVGQANEFKLACRRAGYTNADVKRLCEGGMLARFLPVMRGFSMVVPFNFVLDCFKPFDPVVFIGAGWKEVKRDERAYAMTQVDFSKCQFLTKKGDDIKGEEKLRRLKEEYPQFIRHGGNQFLALWEDYQRNGADSVLEHLRLTQGITGLDFPGLILQGPDGRDVLYLYWGGYGWDWHYNWFDGGWYARCRSSVSPAS